MILNLEKKLSLTFLFKYFNSMATISRNPTHYRYSGFLKPYLHDWEFGIRAETLEWAAWARYRAEWLPNLYTASTSTCYYGTVVRS
jgi:hypothetical protein